MAIDTQHHAVGISNRVISGRKKPDVVFSQAFERLQIVDTVLQGAFTELDKEVRDEQGIINYTNLLGRKGEEWVQAMGSELGELHATLVPEIESFGDTYELSRVYKQQVAASQREIEDARWELGRRVFEDLAHKFIVAHAEGGLVDESIAPRVWEELFDYSARQRAQRHMLEVGIGLHADADGTEEEQYEIQRVWVVIPDTRIRDLADYQAMMEDIEKGNPSVNPDTEIIFVVPADSSITEQRDKLVSYHVQIAELPILKNQIYGFGADVLDDTTQHADSASLEETPKYVAHLHPLSPALAAVERMRVDALDRRQILPHSSITGETVTLRQRMEAAYPPDVDENLAE